MYKVTIIEKWRNHITANRYTFNDPKMMQRFISMCEEDNILIIVHNSSKSA